MAYVGQEPNGSFTTNVSKDTFDGDGSTTAFTLTEGASTNTVDVFVENVRQEPTEAYSVDGTTLTFTAAPPTGTGNIYVVNKSPVRLQAAHPAGLALEAHSATISTDLTVGGTVDIQGNELILDADGDTSITSDTDDQIDFKTGGTDRMAIDASGNVLVGKTTPDSTTVGVEARQSGILTATRDSGTPVTFGRNTSDGAIVNLQKGSTVVGTIGTFSTSTSYCGASSGIYFNGVDINPTTGDPTVRTDNVNSIGQASQRFKDLYLGGGVYLGGTGSTNHLDDYEIGTCTLTTNVSGGLTQTTSTRYTKIGRLVTVHFDFTFGVDTSGAGMTVSGLPYNTLNYGSGIINWTSAAGDMPGSIHVYSSGGNASFTIQLGTDGNTAMPRNIASGNRFIGSLFYDADS